MEGRTFSGHCSRSRKRAARVRWSGGYDPPSSVATPYHHAAVTLSNPVLARDHRSNMSSSRPFPAPDMAASLLDALEGHGQGLWDRSEEHTSELQSLMRISYAVFCLKKHTTSLEAHRNINKLTP